MKSFLAFISIAIFILITGCSKMTDEISFNDVRIYGKTKDRWVEKTLSKMTLEEKAGQIVFPAVNAYYMSRDSNEYRRIEKLVKERHVGGLIFFLGEPYDQAIITNKMQAIAKIPLLISADFEHSVSMRLDRAAPFPKIMALGAVDDTNLTYEMAKAIAKEGRAIGVHHNYAPVSDVNNNPLNPIINIRSFGESPDLVAKHSKAFLRGLQENGMVATSKHFPGHGNTSIDSHLDLPVIDVSLDSLYKVELYPFIESINSGVMSIMVGHLSVPAIDSTKNLPSSLSKRIVTDLLKKQLGFKGLIVTDAMNMHGVVNYFSTADATIKAIQAGIDCILFPDDPDEAIDAIIKSVKSGIITEERLNQSIRKILLTKKWLGLHKNKFIDLDKLFETVGRREHHMLARKISRKAITCVKNEFNLIPLNQSPTINYSHIIIIDSKSNDAGELFDTELKRRLTNYNSIKINLSSVEDDFINALEIAKKSNKIIISVYSRVRSYKGTIRLHDKHMELINSLISLNIPTVMISHGNPYLLMEFPQVNAYINNYGDTKYLQTASVEALFGEIQIQGKLPVSIPNTDYKIGHGIVLPKSSLLDESKEFSPIDEKHFSKVDSIMNKSIQDSVFPGGVLLIAKDGEIIYHKAFGNLTYEPTSPKVKLNTIYDLASLTKVIATTTAIMILLDERIISLNDKVQKYFPGFIGRLKEKVTIKNLLLHNSGLPAWKNFYQTCKSADEVLSEILKTELEYEPETKTVYSDLGMILLGKLIERITEQTLDEFCRYNIFNPLGMNITFFNPDEKLKTRIAPTEYDSTWRKTLVHGKVHDENAFTMGGVAGHAGLFSTAEDIAKFLQMILQHGKYQGLNLIDSNTIKLFTNRQNENSSRALGWDTNFKLSSSAGKLFSENSFGHTGFTGTSMWVDPEKNMFVILLTNRVHPTRNNTKLIQLRPIIHSIIMETIDNISN